MAVPHAAALIGLSVLTLTHAALWSLFPGRGVDGLRPAAGAVDASGPMDVHVGLRHPGDGACFRARGDRRRTGVHRGAGSGDDAGRPRRAGLWLALLRLVRGRRMPTAGGAARHRTGSGAARTRRERSNPDRRSAGAGGQLCARRNGLRNDRCRHDRVRVDARRRVEVGLPAGRGRCRQWVIGRLVRPTVLASSAAPAVPRRLRRLGRHQQPAVGRDLRQWSSCRWHMWRARRSPRC